MEAESVNKIKNNINNYKLIIAKNNKVLIITGNINSKVLTTDSKIKLKKNRDNFNKINLKNEKQQQKHQKQP